MLSFVALPDKHPVFPGFLRYLIATASVSIAFSIALVLQHAQIRDPFALIFLAAIAISVWYGGDKAGIVGIVLSTLGLTTFLHSSGGWLRMTSYDLGVYCIYFFFISLIWQFSRTRRRTEVFLHEASARLEGEVQARTVELSLINAEYKTILDAAPFGIALFGPNRIVLRCNPAYEKMIGFDAGELIGKEAPLPDTQKEIWKSQEEQLREGRQIVNYEAPRIRKDRSEFSATISMTPLIDAHGTYTGLVGLIIDNTERRAQEAERTMLTALVQRSPNVIAVANLAGSVVFLNQAGQELHGLQGEEEARRTNLLDYFVEYERRPDGEGLIPSIERHRQLSFETYGHNFRTGGRFPLHCTCFVIPDAKTGKPAFFAAVAEDISERKVAEEKLQMFCSVVQHSPDFIGVTGLDLKPIFLNPAGQTKCGVDGDEQVTQTYTLDYFADGERARVRDEVIPLLLEQGQLTIEIPARNLKTGRTFPALWTAFVIYDKKTKEPSLLAAVVKDITEQHEDRAALRKSLSENELLLEENKVLQEQLQRENISLQEINLALQGELADIQRIKFEKIIGGSPGLLRTLNKVRQVASSDATVLITGETGTGKELIAQAIHEHSKRAHMPFRSVNCAAVPATLLSAELFGHEKGAFTGADRQRVGQFELAVGGTLFLDEIAEIPIEMQAALLRVLEEHTFQRLGGTKVIYADVRIIAATNRDLHTAMRAGEFRQDLFYRLNSFPIEVPPLRERRDDIPMLVSHFVAISAVEHGKTIRNIEKRGMDLLRSYDWPGNIRELRNVIDTSVITANGEGLVIDEELLFATRPHDDAPIGSLQKEMESHERMLIERTLAETQGRVYGPAGAGAILHIPPTTLSAKIKTLKIDTAKFRPRSS
jgi:PAS domain S-box-containing protein